MKKFLDGINEERAYKWLVFCEVVGNKDHYQKFDFLRLLVF